MEWLEVNRKKYSDTKSEKSQTKRWFTALKTHSDRFKNRLFKIFLGGVEQFLRHK